MRRRLSLALLAILIVLTVFASSRYLSPRAQRSHRGMSLSDTVAWLDSARRTDSRQDTDTMCFASRIFLPCDPR
jgi:hypothetical protein